MKKLTFAKSIATMGLAAVCALGVTGCSSEDNGAETPTYTGGVAATVNGTEIEEDTVTQAIQDLRTQMGLTDEKAWGEWLAEYDYTPESVRTEMIDGFIDQELVNQGSGSLGVEADQAQVDEFVDQMRSNYDSDEAWQQALQSVGLTEEKYRENIALSLVSQDLKTKLAEDLSDPSDEELVETAQSYLTSFNGAKKSSHVLFDASDEALAKEVLAKIQSGELDFAKAATDYSKDTGSSGDGGNVGWDKLTNFVTEYSTALANLNKDEVSDLVTSSYGIHIIKCTDVFEAPSELTSLDQLPAEFQETVRSAYASNAESQAYYSWLEQQREAADIQINDMPEGLPYYVNMDDYPKSEDDMAGITAIDENGNPITLDGAEVTTGTEQGAEGAEGAEGTTAEGDQSAEGDAAQPAEGAEGDATAGGESGETSEGDQSTGDANQQPAEGATE